MQTMQKTPKKRSYAVLHVFWTLSENTMLLHDKNCDVVAISCMGVAWGLRKMKNAW